MKKSWDELYEMVGPSEFTGKTITSNNVDSDVIMHFYDVGEDKWVSIWEDYDVRDDESESQHTRINLNGSALRDLYEELKQIFEY